MAARTVSRAGDDGKSTPVPVVDLDGVIEAHRIDPADLGAARAPIAAPVVTGVIPVTDWIENLMFSVTNFSSAKGSFKLAAAGFHGSIQPIGAEIRNDPFVLRAVQRGRIAFITEAEAYDKIVDLKEENTTSESHMDHLRDSLNAGASEKNGLYKIPLPDEAEPSGPSKTWEQVWEQSDSTPKQKNV